MHLSYFSSFSPCDILQLGLSIFANHKRENFFNWVVISGKYSTLGTVQLSNYLPIAGLRKLSSLQALNNITYEYITI